MISTLRGILQQKSVQTIIVECGGVGYRVHVPLSVVEKLPSSGQEVFLLTEFIVRPESQVLYGFLQEQERLLFVRLTKVSGIGAKMALGMLSAMTIDELVIALSNEDSARLSTIPGIGKKTADRIIVDFRGSPLLLKTAIQAPVDSDVEQALAALGYNKGEIKKALSQLSPFSGEDIATRVRAALRVLSGRV